MRRKDREITDREITDPKEIQRVLENSTVLRLGLSDDNRPYIVPMNFGFAYGSGLVIYLHCANKGKKLDIIAKNNAACFEVESRMEVVVGESCNTFRCKYESVIGFGLISVVRDKMEKRLGLDVIVRQYAKDKTLDFSDSALDAVTVLKLSVDEVVGKSTYKKAECDDAEYVLSPVRDYTIDDIKEFVGCFTAAGERRINGSCRIQKFTDYRIWLDYIRRIEAGEEPDKTKSSVMFFVRKSDNKKIGIIDVRHGVTPLTRHNGHVGLSIVPDERRKGLGRKLLKLGFDYCKKLGNSIATVSCDEMNTASKQMIEGLGCEYRETIIEENGNRVLLYSINLEE